MMGLHVDENRFFRKLTLQVAGCMDMDTAVRRCMDTLADIMPVDIMSFHSYTFKTGILKTLAAADETGRILPHDPIVMSDEQQKQIQALWSTRVWRIPELGKDPITAGAARSLGLEKAGVMLMDLTLEQKLTGVVAVANTRGYAYTEADADLLTILNEPLAIALSNGIRFKEIRDLKNLLARDNEFLRRELSRQNSPSFIGAESGLKEVAGQAARVSALDSPVLLIGETGTGKEIIARAIHDRSPRKDRPFVPVNCGALARNLVDSELFGHEKGAFTGAFHRHTGRFEQAEGGTLFLDEIGELSPKVQVRLLRVLQEKQVQRIGGKAEIPLDVRIIAATHRDIPGMVEKGLFREDLYFRISVFPLHIPPLRDRPQDIPALAAHFVKSKSLAMNKLPIPDILDKSFDRMARYQWPGNVREMENLIERALILHDSGPLLIDPFEARPEAAAKALAPQPPASGIQTLAQVNTAHIKTAMALAKGRIEGPGGAAQLLDIHPSTLRKRMDRLGIAYGRKAAQGG